MSNVAKLREPTETAEPVGALAKMREEFPAHQISKLPKETKQQADARKADFKTGVRCKTCGGWHHKDAVHLDYVGHAALTHRMLEADIEWNWKPMALTAEGLPAFDRNGGLWIWLTIGGVTRLGYGAADGKTGGDAIKEVIGDALRNSGMRFGAALDLWHKGDLHLDDDGAAERTVEPAPQSQAATLAIQLLAGAKTADAFKATWKTNADGWKGVMSAEDYGRVKASMKSQWIVWEQRIASEAPPMKDGETPFDDPIDFGDSFPGDRDRSAA